MTGKKARESAGMASLNQEQLIVIRRRLKRAYGQLGAVVRMFEEGQSCDDIVVHMAAVSKAINTAAFTLISENLKICILEDESSAPEVTERLQKLFLSLV